MGRWAQRYSRLELSAVADRSGQTTVVLGYHSGRLRLLTAVVAMAVIVAAVTATAMLGDETIAPAFGLAAMTVVGFLIFRSTRVARLTLRDDVLNHAAARLAMAEGLRSSAGRWLVSGELAQAAYFELRRLHTFPGPDVHPSTPNRPQLREQALLDLAAPLLRPYLAPVLTAAPSGMRDFEAYYPGSTLTPPSQQSWPLLQPPPNP